MLNFNFKKSSVSKVEKYDFPVMTLVPAYKKGGVTKFCFNEAAVKLLELEGSNNFVSMAMNENNDLVVVKTTNIDAPFKFKVNKDFSVNSKKFLSILESHFYDKFDAEKEFGLTADTSNEDYNSAIVTILLHANKNEAETCDSDKCKDSNLDNENEAETTLIAESKAKEKVEENSIDLDNLAETKGCDTVVDSDYLNKAEDCENLSNTTDLGVASDETLNDLSNFEDGEDKVSEEKAATKDSEDDEDDEFSEFFN